MKPFFPIFGPVGSWNPDHGTFFGPISRNGGLLPSDLKGIGCLNTILDSQLVSGLSCQCSRDLTKVVVIHHQHCIFRPSVTVAAVSEHGLSVIITSRITVGLTRRRSYNFPAAANQSQDNIHLISIISLPPRTHCRF